MLASWAARLAEKLWLPEPSARAEKYRESVLAGCKTAAMPAEAVPLLAEAADQQRVAVGAVETDHVDGGFAAGGEQSLADAQHRRAGVNPEQLRDAGAGGRGVHLFVRILQFDAVIALQRGEQGAAFQWQAEQTRELLRGKIADLHRERLLTGLPQPFQLHQPAVRRKRQPRGSLLLVFHDARAQDPRARRQTPAGHLLGEAGQAVEV